jgi:glycosyltransferase involved in cell wall biosynthesis
MTQPKPKISILMPIYNGIEFIEESVNSILNQSYTEWELLIGINGHPPNSTVYKKAKLLIDNLTSITNKIQLYELPIEYIGKSITLNQLVQYISSSVTYIALLDVDDVWHENKLKIQSGLLDKYDIIGSQCIWFGEREGIIPPIPTGDISNFDFTIVNPIINSSCLIRKEYANWDCNTPIEDYELWLRLRSLGKTFYNYKEILVKHRIHRASFFNSHPENNVHAQSLVNTIKNSYL